MNIGETKTEWSILGRHATTCDPVHQEILSVLPQDVIHQTPYRSFPIHISFV